MKLADYFTWARLILVVPISAAILVGWHVTAMVLYLLGVLTDILDGYIARKTKTASKAGAKLDSRIDTVVLFFYLWWLWLLFPQLLREYWVWAISIVALIFVELSLAKIYLGSWTGLHLYSQKASALAAAALLPALVLFGFIEWLVWGVIAVGILCNLDGIVYLLRGGKNLDAKWFLSPIR